MNDAKVRTITDRITLSDGAEVATTTLEPLPGARADNERRLGEVLICHGTPWSSRMWLPLARKLAQHHRVRLWDMPGYGDSIPEITGTPPQPIHDPLAEAAPAVDLITQRRRLAELIDYWEISKPHVIAHDIGGAVALGTHLLEGCDFASMYLLDIVTLDLWGSPFFRLVAENAEVFAALPPQLHRALVHEYIAGAGGHSLNDAQVCELSAPWITPSGQSAFYAQIAALLPEHTAPIVDRLGEVRCPVRIGWGEDDPWIPVEQSCRLARLLPEDPGLTCFPGAGHLVPIEAPDDLTTDIELWINSLLPLEGGSTRSQTVR
ncbi:MULTISPECIES: alpha/beta fold hydrolase [unclassified Brevibacterium]|uniref:alpha/beta fold hydrolase n=1 Tax=unclassified Brevibacterium TaxID=2614124 RepID=UPI001092EDA7|nr:alpha/beta hydrolase [Brevibacterium sp. S22]TGD27953.1 alpha/beta hydrolase [Brevibacterium sp. S22]